MRYLLGIDLGTSYFKAAIFDGNGQMLGLGREAVDKVENRPGQCELPLESFWKILAKAIEGAAAGAGISAERIDAVGYSSQANSYLLLESDGSALTPLILWPDSRGNYVYPQAERLWNEPEFIKTTGIGIAANTCFMVNKLLWHKEQQPVLWKKVRHIKTISDYLIYSLTGRHLSDLGTSSLLGILDAKNERWWQKGLDIIGIDESMLCDNIRSGEKCGDLTPQASRLLGLKQGIPLFAGSLDHHMAAIGAGIGELADTSESTGTVVACVNVTERFEPQKNVCVSNSIRQGEYFQLAYDLNGAVSLEWYRDLFAPKCSVAELIELAEKTDSTAALAAKAYAYKYKGLEAFEGITARHTHGHFVRAILESVALTLRELILKLNAGEMPEAVVSTGGGARSRFWLELKSQLTGGTRFFAAECEEPACKGAAMICIR
jgi:sugar (pentulose or hexulose) kinase